MPEGPEVACLSEELNKNLKNKMLKDFEFIGGRYVKHTLPEYFKEFKDCLPLKIIKVEYKGKLIIFHFDSFANFMLNNSKLQKFSFIRQFCLM